MRLPPIPAFRNHMGLLNAGVFFAAAIVSLLVAWGALRTIESMSLLSIESALLLEGEEWAEVDTSGLQVILSGTAPTESARFHALSIAGSRVDASRVIDQMEVPPPKEITPPRFSVEILRSEAGISMIGLIPAATDRDELGERIQKIDFTRAVTDLLETADYPEPVGWNAALDYALAALELLPRAKISMNADRVAIQAIANSQIQKTEWERRLRAQVPGGLRLSLDISAPRPVITPFTLRFTIDKDGARFDACTASNDAGRTKIEAAGIAAGVTGRPTCTIGLGVPSPDWPDAVSRGIGALRDMGGGSLTFSDADVTLVAAEGTPQNTFDRVIGELEADLPDVFSLHSVLPDPVTISGTGESDGPPEFVATRSPEGLVQLRGRVADEQERTITESFARARFGVENVYAAMRLDPELPRGWSVRTLAALEALAQLANGAVVVQPVVVDVRGATGDKGASAEISRILSEKLGEAEDFRVNVRYEEKFDPAANMPTPEECAADVNATLAESKITFSPGSAEIEPSSARTVDRIAEILKRCPDVAMEVAGYTDSQGREEMNKALSQRRADSVLSALLARRVLTSNFTAFGYGEADPIADNDTEEGREANRRIEFRLIGVDPVDGDADTEAQAGADPDAAMPAIRPQARPEEGAAEGDEAEGETPDAAATPADTQDPDEATEEEVVDPGSGADETAGQETGDGTESLADADAAETDNAAEPAPEAGEETVDEPPLVVDPELEGIRPQPRPDDNDG